MPNAGAISSSGIALFKRKGANSSRAFMIQCFFHECGCNVFFGCCTPHVYSYMRVQFVLRVLHSPVYVQFECCTVSLINAGATSSTGVVLLVNLCNYQCSMWGECKVMIIVSALIIAHCLFSDEFK